MHHDTLIQSEKIYCTSTSYSTTGLNRWGITVNIKKYKLVSIDGKSQNNRVCKKIFCYIIFSKIFFSNYRISTRHISLKTIAGAAGAKILKRKSPTHGFPMQKQCFGSVSEAFSTAKPCKILEKFRAFGPNPKKTPPFS